MSNNLNKKNCEITAKTHRKISTFLCQLLRHNPEKANIELNEEGWTSVPILVSNINEFCKRDLKKNKLEQLFLQDIIDIFYADKKHRYFKIGDFDFIRCDQGHSHPSVKIKYDRIKLEHDIFHGTATKFIDSIMQEGLLPQKRQYVHLSKDRETAVTVGKRHSGTEEPVILRIKKDTPIDFFITGNGVYHALAIPPEFLHIE